MTESLKKCRRCLKSKTPDDFGRLASQPDGLNPICKNCRNELGRRFNKTVKAKSNRKRYKSKDEVYWRERDLYLRRKYGITLAQVQQLLTTQGGRCAICERGNPDSKDTWHVDHDHETKKVRGILCFKCNRALGMVGDNLTGILRFVRYLEKTSQAPVGPY